MRDLLLLAVACLVWLGSWSTGATPASDTVDTRGGRIAPGFYVTIQGKLVALPTPAWLGELGVGYVIQANGQQVYVSFGSDPKLLEALSKLGDERVRLNGTLELVDDPREDEEPEDVHDFIFRLKKKILVVRATRLEEAKDSNNKDELSVTAVGHLHPQPLQSTIFGPPRLWEVVAGKQSLPFSAWGGDLLKDAVALQGNVVVATGTLKNGAFVASTLMESL